MCSLSTCLCAECLLATRVSQGSKERKEWEKRTNKHKLPAPMDDEDAVGDLIVFRNDMDAEPLDLPLKVCSEIATIRAPDLPRLHKHERDKFPSIRAPDLPRLHEPETCLSLACDSSRSHLS